VIPNGYRYNNETESVNGKFRPLHPHEFLDIDLVSRIINLTSHEQYVKSFPNPNVINLIFDVNTTVFCSPAIPASGSPVLAKLLNYATGRSVFELTNSAAQHTTINIKNPMLEHFYTFIFFLDQKKAREYRRLVRDYVKVKPTIIRLGTDIARKLGYFNAVHVRRTDFIRLYPDQNIPARSLLNNIKKYIIPGTRLYISTDEPNHEFFNIFSRYYQIFFLSNVIDGARTKIPKASVACLEQIICSLAQVFVGTRLSTFSGYITRLRGYRNVSNKEIYFTDGYEIKDEGEFSWMSWVKAGNPLWGREFREGWET
jgi:hypothetical protein